MYKKPFKPLLTLLIVSVFLSFGCQQNSSASTEKAMTADEAQKALKPIIPDVKVISIEPAAVEGLWEVVIESKGEKGILYLDSEGKKLVVGQIMEIATKTNYTQLKFEEINKVDFSSIPLDDTIVLGDREAKHKVVVFDDPD